MTTTQANAIVEARFKKCREILTQKASEYANDEERLHNFNIAAGIGDGTPGQALYWFMTKHLASLQDMLYGRLKPTRELLDEKITDVINYAVLAEMMLSEQTKTVVLQDIAVFSKMPKDESEMVQDILLKSLNNNRAPFTVSSKLLYPFEARTLANIHGYECVNEGDSFYFEAKKEPEQENE